ncbi:VRR-NUC domain-containing protein [Rapidithrix thailandica]|uniref:phosphodiesterase I n=1 Tax=Rapidithrix thailandica TaxID=413964 RepID=A0AAW9SFG3_9BACT
MPDQTPIQLPPKYYLENFRYLIGFVQEQYASVLEEPEQTFISKFNALSEDAQCLYLRMMNRKGVFFRIKKFQYAEIASIPTAEKELIERGFIQLVKELSLPEVIEVMQIFTKPELIKIFQGQEGFDKSLKKLPKGELLLTLVSLWEPEELVEALQAFEEVVSMLFVQEATFLQFLFFGSLRYSMSEFVIRDIGNARFQVFDPEQFTPLFHTRLEAVEKFNMTLLYREFKRQKELLSAEEIYEWFRVHFPDVPELTEPTVPVFGRMVQRVGGLLERAKLWRQAEKIYQYANKPPIRERRVRVLEKMGERDEALALCVEIEEEPHNADEYYFARDFQHKHQKDTRFLKATTRLLKKAEQMEVPLQFKESVEMGVLEQLAGQGYEGFFAENYLWRALFGLLCWEEIFDESTASIHHPLQRRPSDLFGEQFLAKRKQKLQKRLQLLEHPQQAMNYLGTVFREKEGTVNPFVGWFPDTMAHLDKLLSRVPGASLQSVLWEIAKSPENNTRGFPDLYVWKEQRYDFIEVKSPNDQLSNQQLYWMEFFRKKGIRVKVLRVHWGE